MAEYTFKLSHVGFEINSKENVLRVIEKPEALKVYKEPTWTEGAYIYVGDGGSEKDLVPVECRQCNNLVMHSINEIDTWMFKGFVCDSCDNRNFMDLMED